MSMSVETSKTMLKVFGIVDILFGALLLLFSAMTLAGGGLLALGGQIFLAPVARFLGAEGELLEGSLIYGRISLVALPFFMLQFLFQTFFGTAEKPRL